MNPTLLKTAENTVEHLKQRNLTVATAESCTGGLVAAALTSVSGVSQVFGLGITSYSCEIKHKVLGVESEILEKFGAISEQTADRMAENVRKKAGAEIGASVTGVAGPSCSEGHPVGYIFIAVSGALGTKHELLNLENKGRQAVREEAACNLLRLIDDYIKELK